MGHPARCHPSGSENLVLLSMSGLEGASDLHQIPRQIERTRGQRQPGVKREGHKTAEGADQLLKYVPSRHNGLC